MKNYIVLLIVSIFVLSFSVAVHAQDIRAVINEISPQPVEPGNDMTMKVTFTNLGKDFISNLNAFIDLNYPFTLKASSEPYDKGFELCQYCFKANNYYISVDTNAKSGTYPIFVRVRNTLGAETTKSFNVTIRGIPNIAISAEPIANATPGDDFVVKLNILNIGTGFANEMKIVPRATDFVSLSGIMTLPYVNPKNSSYVEFDMSPNPELDAGSYNLPFEISYKDEQGNQFNVTQDIGIRLVNEGMLSVENIKVASDTGQAVAGSPISVIVRLQNIGHGNANYIQAEIACDGQRAKAFLGQLKRDEDAPAVFDITLSQGGKHQCTLVTNYVDDTGSKTVTSAFDITIKNPELPFGGVGIIIIVAGVLYYYYHRRHKKK